MLQRLKWRIHVAQKICACAQGELQKKIEKSDQTSNQSLAQRTHSLIEALAASATQNLNKNELLRSIKVVTLVHFHRRYICPVTSNLHLD